MYGNGSFPDGLHETTRAIQSSRLVRVPFRTMSACYVTSGSTAAPLRASCVGERVAQSPLKSPFSTHSPPGPPKVQWSERMAMADSLECISLVLAHVWAPCRHAKHSPTPSGAPYAGPLRVRGAIVRKRFISRRLARDLPCDPKLAPGAGAFSHDVRMLPDLRKHCCASPRFMRRREGRLKSPQVTVFYTQSA